MLQRFSLLLLISLLPQSLWADEVSTTLTLSRRTVSVDSPFQFEVTVKGTRSSEDPKFKKSKDFDIRSAGSSTQVSIVNGSMTSSVVYTFVAYPKNDGMFTLGPAVVEIEGRNLTTNSVQVKVLPAKAKAPEETYYYLEAQVDDDKPYIGQQVTYFLRFFRRVQIASGQYSLPDFQGFLKEPPSESHDNEIVKDGVRWVVAEIQQPLFPNKKGILEIPPAILTGNVVQKSQNQRRRSIFDSPFFSSSRMQEIRLRSDPIRLNVRPLPTKDRPKNFSTLVGNIKIEANLSKTEMSVGESATLTVKLTGNAKLRGAELPQFQISGIKSYDDKPTFQLFRDKSVLMSQKVFKRAIVPTEPGQTTLPSLKISYFSIKTEKYENLQTPRFTISISPSVGETNIAHTSAQPGIAKKNLEILADDITPLKTTPSGLKIDEMSETEKQVFHWGLVFLPIFYLLLLHFRRRQLTLQSDANIGRKALASGAFKKNFRKLSNSANFFEDSSLVLRSYIGDKTGIDGKALTNIDIQRHLGPKGVSDALIADLTGFLKTCEMAQFGGQSHSPEEKEKLLENLKGIGRRLEKEIR